MQHTTEFRVKRQCGAISTRVLLIALGAVLIVLLASYFLYPGGSQEPPGSVAPVPVATPEERGDSAREVIKELQSSSSGVDYAEAYEQALEYQEAGRFADAQLLYFFAARGNYAPAAFDLATMYDPNHHSTATSVMDKPNAAQAYKWYRQARDAGNTEAVPRLGALKTWAEQAAGDGDTAADQLILRWE